MPSAATAPARRIAWVLILLGASAGTLAAIRDPQKLPPKNMLVITTLPLPPDRSVTLAEYFTGEKSEKSGIDLLLGVYRVDGDRRELAASRSWNSESGGYVSRGSLEVSDLDRDGTSEVLVYYHHLEQPGSTRVDLDVLRVGEDRMLLAWSGPFKVDTTSPELRLPPAERERFVREIDYVRTAAQGGRRIVFKKTTLAAAGVPIDPPRTSLEEIDFLPGPVPSPPRP